MLFFRYYENIANRTNQSIQGIPSVERAVVNPVRRRDKSLDRYNLLVEG
jgi:hypothetical protein